MIEKNTESNIQELKHRRKGGAFDIMARIFRNVIKIVFSTGAVIEDRMSAGEGYLTKADSVFQIYHQNKSSKDGYNFIYLGREGKGNYNETNYLGFSANEDSNKVQNEDYKANGNIVFAITKDGKAIPGAINIRNASGLFNTAGIPNSNNKEGLVFLCDTRADGQASLAYTKMKDGSNPNSSNMSDIKAQWQCLVDGDGAYLVCFGGEKLEPLYYVGVSESGIQMYGLPTTDPGKGNKIWNDGGTLKITDPLT